MMIKGKDSNWIYVYAVRGEGAGCVRTVSISGERMFCDCPAFDRLATCEHIERAWQLYCREEQRNKHLGVELLPDKEK